MQPDKVASQSGKEGQAKGRDSKKKIALTDYILVINQFTYRLNASGVGVYNPSVFWSYSIYS